METVSIRPFRPGDAAAFQDLNEAWISRYFTLESKDREVLGDPEHSILAKGGIVLMAEKGGAAVGCCALLPMPEATFEVSKMAVAETAQGAGVGRKLLAAVIEQARQLGAARLYLETNDILVPAIRLYQSLGFTHLPPERVPVSPYARANVYMELLLG